MVKLVNNVYRYTKKELIEKYQRYERNLNNNLRFEESKKKELEESKFIDEYKKIMEIESIERTIEHMKGSQSVIREILRDLTHKEPLENTDSKYLDYLLGNPL